jgi:hypothetical protein
MYAPNTHFRLLPNQSSSLVCLTPLIMEKLICLIILKIFLTTPAKRHIEIGEATPKNAPQCFYVHFQSLGA